MDKNKLKEYIARTAYNIGFGAKKNFASYDIISNANEYISMVSMVIGILALVFDSFNEKIISVLLLIAGILGLYISKFESKLEIYNEIGKANTRFFNSLTILYNKVDEEKANINDILSQVREIEKEFYLNSISKQVYLSDWLAHYKFFYQFQCDWVIKELKLTFWDKVPSGLKLFILFISVFIIFVIIYRCSFFQKLMNYIC